MYAQASLDPAFLVDASALLKRGEPLLATYEFHFYQRHDWLPDRKVVDITIKRRLRPHLITEHFEMRDSQSGVYHYTSDPEEALHFLGKPRFIALTQVSELKSGGRYLLETRILVTHEGVSGLLRLLDRWLALWRPIDQTLQIDYTHP
ncbi:MAG: DUF4390 domain-containing protein [Magnetococcales bacterium]|nr:DUF4390 domain-containing protein [Magnetococcales bacterium]